VKNDFFIETPPQSPFTKGGRKWVLPFGKGELEGILSEVLTQLGYKIFSGIPDEF
jgi:hypothetical protein